MRAGRRARDGGGAARWRPHKLRWNRRIELAAHIPPNMHTAFTFGNVMDWKALPFQIESMDTHGAHHTHSRA